MSRNYACTTQQSGAVVVATTKDVALARELRAARPVRRIVTTLTRAAQSESCNHALRRRGVCPSGQGTSRLARSSNLSGHAQAQWAPNSKYYIAAMIDARQNKRTNSRLPRLAGEGCKLDGLSARFSASNCVLRGL